MPVTLEEFNAAGEDGLTQTLSKCCDAPTWVGAVLSKRPYPDREALLRTASAAARTLTPAEVDRALAAHPRIGERVSGPSPEAAWSRGEQSSVSRDQQTQVDLADANRAYEERFGRVFLICASGLDAQQILEAARGRLDNDDATEEQVVADELRKIALVRLRKVVA
ncbi:MAG: 2-oxo-4-hydroxy-4-carboxy-5-ureidoimidazoline decarboxylase [Nocardioidaceae bacterium]